MSEAKTITRGRLTVRLDRGQVFPDDPGNGTPALVEAPGYCSTYWCACGEGELLGNEDGGTLRLTAAELRWLEGLDQQITEYLYR